MTSSKPRKTASSSTDSSYETSPSDASASEAPPSEVSSAASSPKGSLPERSRPSARPSVAADELRRMRNVHPHLPQDRSPVLRVVPMPADSNQHGDIFGGWIMSQVDIAGGVIAAIRARGRVATVAVNSFAFKEPVMIGDRVSFYADVIRVGNTSITVNVEVFAERNPAQREVVKVTEATLTYVATDAKRRPRKVPD